MARTRNTSQKFKPEKQELTKRKRAKRSPAAGKPSEKSFTTSVTSEKKTSPDKGFYLIVDKESKMNSRFDTSEACDEAFEAMCFTCSSKVNQLLKRKFKTKKDLNSFLTMMNRMFKKEQQDQANETFAETTKDFKVEAEQQDKACTTSAVTPENS